MSATRAHRPLDLIQLLTRAERLMTLRLQSVLDSAGYSVDAWRVLAMLADDAGHRMTEIATHTFLPPSTLTKLIDHLVSDNLLYRRIDPRDRRSVRVYLGPRGRALYQQISDTIEANCVDLVNSGDGGALPEQLARLIDVLDGNRVPEPHLPVA